MNISDSTFYHIGFHSTFMELLECWNGSLLFCSQCALVLEHKGSAKVQVYSTCIKRLSTFLSRKIVLRR